jgi:tetratricopeptide (TPR) repeat protein
LPRSLFPLLLAAAILLPLAGPAYAADAPEVWLELRSPNFIVITHLNEKLARRVAEQFEMFRGVARSVLPRANFDLGRPLVILAVKNEKALKELLPGFWEKKGGMRPAGIFVPGEEKLYIALRTDVQGEFPYQVVYHEYVHALLRKNFENIPVWLNEGFAEFLGHSLIRDNEAAVGRPSLSHLEWLQSTKLLPVETLLTVDHRSPHYNESNRASVFYAQAWATTHFLLLDPRARSANLLENYFKQLDRGVSEGEAAAAAFGDLKKFEKLMETYVRQSSFKYIPIRQPNEIDEAAFAVRALSLGQAAALRGDFHVYMNRPAEARALLQQALQVEPDNAQAHESLGLLALRNRNLDEAARWFAKAAQFDSQSHLAHYYAALLNLQGNAQTDKFDETESNLRRALQLNPSFAPACTMLAMLYASNDDKLEEALALAQKAVQLEPGYIGYRMNLANVLLRMKRVPEAVAVARKALGAAREPGEQAQVNNFITRAEEYQLALARREADIRDAAERAARRAADIAAREQRMKEAADRQAEELAPKLAPGQVVAFGTIKQVTCTGAAALLLTFQESAASLSLRTPDRGKLKVTIGIGTPRNFDPCKSLFGQQAQVVYQPLKGRVPGGEIVHIQLLSGGGVSTELTPTSGPTVGRKPETPAPTGAAPATASAGRAGWSEGKLTGITCNGAEMRLSVNLGGGFFTRLHAADFNKIEFLANPAWRRPDSFRPCVHLNGLQAEVKYVAVEGKPYEGEIVSIEIRTTPEEEAVALVASRQAQAERTGLAAQQSFAIGKVLRAACPGPAQLLVELETEKGLLRLAAAQRSYVAYYMPHGAPRRFDPCRELTDRTVEVVYKPGPARGAAGGELLSIEMK